MPAHVNDLVRLEIDASDAANQISNHSGQGGTITGWTRLFGEAATFAAVSGLPGHYGGKAIRCNTSTSGDFGVQSSTLPCSPGDWVSFQYSLSSDAPLTVVRVVVTFIGASGNTGLSGYGPVSGAEATYRLTAPVQAPPGTTGVQFYVRAWGPSANVPVYFSRAMGVRSINKSLVLDVPFSDGPVWQNVLGSAYSLQIATGLDANGVEDAPQTGSLSAVITDPLLDPSSNPRMRPGRVVRVQANDGSGWRSLYTGKIATLDTAYRSGRPVISLTATDAFADLLDVQCPTTINGTLQQRVDHILAGAPVDYLVYGSGTPITTKVIDVQDGANALDQLTTVRNTDESQVFVDGDNNVVVYQKANRKAQTPGVTFSDSRADSGAVYYTDIDTNFGSQALINTLMIERTNLDEEEGSKTYGPYLNAASVVDWRTRSATLRVNDGVPSALAANYLAVYNQPTIFASSLTFNARDHLATATSLEAYDAVRVKFAAASLDAAYRVLALEHSITPESWAVTVAFRPMEVSSAITVTNPPGGPAAGPADLVSPEPGALASRARSTTFSIANNVNTSIPYNVAITSDGIPWDNANSRWTVPKDGRYSVTALVTFVVNATGTRLALIFINGVQQAAVRAVGSSGVATTMTIAENFKLAAGDTVAIVAGQGSGGALNLDGNAATNRASIAYLGG